MSGSGENGRTGLETLERLFIPLTLWPITQFYFFIFLFFGNVWNSSLKHFFSPPCNAHSSSGITDGLSFQLDGVPESVSRCTLVSVYLCISLYIFMGHAGTNRSRLLTLAWSSWITRGNSRRARVSVEPEAFWLSRNPATPPHQPPSPATGCLCDVSCICLSMPAQLSINQRLDCCHSPFSEPGPRPLSF